MKKNIFVVLLITIFISVNVKADIYDAELALKKENSYGELYDNMPTEVNKGEIITVNLYAQYLEGLKVMGIDYTLRWDSEAFELIENDGKFYKKTSNKNFLVSQTFERKNVSSLYIRAINDEHLVFDEAEKLIELKFMVKSDAKDGVYEIYQDYGSYITLNLNQDYYDAYFKAHTLKYLIGKPKLVFDYTPDDIANNDYIIGEYHFSHDISDTYNGVLTTEYIMLASKSIKSNKKDDMVIYTKNARGQWKNAITNESITPPESFKITYNDMKENYIRNGYYTDINEDIVVQLIQINKNEAIVQIEVNNKEKIGAFATINEDYVSFDSSGKNYKLYFSDNKLTIETNDSYFENKFLEKRANYLLDDFYTSLMRSPIAPQAESLAYIDSNINGLYENENYEIFFTRVSENYAKVCVKEKNNESCIIDTLIERSSDDIYFIRNTNGYDDFKFKFEDNGLILIGLEQNESLPYNGNYSKKTSLSMFDIIKRFMEVGTYYYVSVSDNIGEFSNAYGNYVKYGAVLDGNYFTNPTRDGYEFMGWQKNGEPYEITTPVTESMNLVAIFRPVHAAPVLSVYDGSSSYEKILKINSNSYKDDNGGFVINGYSIFEKGNDVALQELDPQEEYHVNPKTNKTFIAKAFNVIAGRKYYTDSSNEVVVNTLLPVPTLYKDTNYQEYNAEEGSYKYKLGISGIENFIVGDPNAEHVVYSIDGFTVYDKQTGNSISDVAINEMALVSIPSGETKSFYAKLYVRYNNEKVYSDASEDIEIVTVPVPTLLSGHLDFANNQYSVPLFIDSENHTKITGYTLQRKLDRAGDVFTNYGTGHNPADSVNEITTPGWRYIYRARAKYEDEHGNTYYSDYSNEVAVGYTKYENPVISLDGDPIVIDGTRKIKIKIDNLDSYYYTSSIDSNDKTLIINGIEIYDGDTIVDSNNISGDLVSGITVSIPESFTGTKQYKAKVYAINTSSNKVYSENYSNVINYTISN